MRWKEAATHSRRTTHLAIAASSDDGLQFPTRTEWTASIEECPQRVLGVRSGKRF